MFKAEQNDTSQTFCSIVVKAHHQLEDASILPGGVHSVREGVGVLDSIAPLLPAREKENPFRSQAWLWPAWAHMYGKHSVTGVGTQPEVQVQVGGSWFGRRG